jgi:hypothetical protein
MAAIAHINNSDKYTIPDEKNGPCKEGKWEMGKMERKAKTHGKPQMDTDKHR